MSAVLVHIPKRGLRHDVDGARSITALVEMHTLIQPHEHDVCSLCHMHFQVATALPASMLSISPPVHMASGPSAQILTDTTRATRNKCPPRRPSKHIGRSTARQTRAHCLRRRRLTTTRVPKHRPINPTMGGCNHRARRMPTVRRIKWQWLWFVSSHIIHVDLFATRIVYVAMFGPAPLYVVVAMLRVAMLRVARAD